jgi:hypothetical protein
MGDAHWLTGDTEMVIKVYSKDVENVRGVEDGSLLDRIYKG